MRVLKVFLVGLLYGWFLRWIIDEIYVKDNLRIITNENIQLRDRIRMLETPKPLETRPIMQAMPSPQPDPLPAPAPTPTRTTVRRSASQKDDLKVIKGIGPAMEKKLNAAGVNTFEQFSRLTAQQLQNILGISKRVVQSTDNLLTQAKQLAQQRAKR
jgi:predicted flap endonuclease-1-like 5' DNA nuclease